MTVDIPGAGTGANADTGAGATRATLVYIYGPPASGKLTIAGRLAELTGMPLFHNHLTVTALRPVFPFGSPAFMEANRKMRHRHRPAEPGGVGPRDHGGTRVGAVLAEHQTIRESRRLTCEPRSIPVFFVTTYAWVLWIAVPLLVIRLRRRRYAPRVA